MNLETGETVTFSARRIALQGRTRRFELRMIVGRILDRCQKRFLELHGHPKMFWVPGKQAVTYQSSTYPGNSGQSCPPQRALDLGLGDCLFMNGSHMVTTQNCYLTAKYTEMVVGRSLLSPLSGHPCCLLLLETEVITLAKLICLKTSAEDLPLLCHPGACILSPAVFPTVM